MQPFRHPRTPTAIIYLALVAITPLLAPAPARAQFSGPPPSAFTDIADTSTTIPHGTGIFTSFGVPAVSDNGSVVFAASGPPGQQGVYSNLTGTLTAIADTNTVVPGGAGLLDTLPDGVAISGNEIAFRGTGDGGQDGIYVSLGGFRTPIANTFTSIPGGTGNFSNFPAGPSISGNKIAFEGDGSGGQIGVYAYVSGTLQKVMDTNTPIPGGTGNFTSVPADPCISFSNVVFNGAGNGGQDGLYKTDVGSNVIEKIADTNTPISAGTGNFASFSSYASDEGGETAVFTATGSGGQAGVYKYVNDTLSVVADVNTPIPGGTGDFVSVPTDPCIDGDAVAFVGNGANGQQGIYTDFGGTLTDVIDISQELDGKQLASLSTGRFAMAGDPMLTFQATFTDGSQGIFEVAVPEPTSLTLLLMCGAGALVRPGKRN